MEVIVNWFLDVLEGIVTVFASVLSLINPDPFPAIIQSLDFANDVSSRAFGWINAFVDVSTLISIFEAWCLMFGTAWGIMLILKWLKAR